MELEAADPPDVLGAARVRNNLALHYKQQGNYALAEQHYLRSMEVLETSLGKECEEVGSLYNNVGSLYYSAGFAEQAKEAFQEALAIRKAVLGDNHPDVAQSLINLGIVHYELGEDEAALQCYQEGIGILESLLPDKELSYLAATDDYIALLGALGKDHEAAEFQEQRDARLGEA